MYGYIYITTPKSGNWCYIGKHKGTKFDTKYVGSGVIIKHYLKTHSRSNIICKPIEWCETLEELNEAEKNWITIFKEESGDFLKNISEGGDGITSEQSQKMWADPNYREKIYKSMGSPEVKEKLSKATKNRWNDPEYKEKTLKAMNTPEAREKHSKAAKNKWNDPEYKEKTLKAMNTPEAREKHSKALKETCKNTETKKKKSKATKKYWENPEYREKLCKAIKDRWTDPEYREKNSKAIKEAVNTPEAREKKSKALKGKPTKKFYWQTLSGEIKIMAKHNVKQWHKDWIEIGPVE